MRPGSLYSTLYFIPTIDIIPAANLPHNPRSRAGAHHRQMVAKDPTSKQRASYRRNAITDHPAMNEASSIRSDDPIQVYDSGGF